MASKKPCMSRLRKELNALLKEPVPGILAIPHPKNLLDWHFVLEGPEDTPYEGGQYWGRLRFPQEYPFKPPTITMITPSGRFVPNTPICSFMVEDEITAGSMESSAATKKDLAIKSWAFNRADKLFQELFPTLCALDDDAGDDEAAEDPRSAPAASAEQEKQAARASNSG